MADTTHTEGTTMTPTDNTSTPILHVDGTVTYWSVYRQQWVRCAHGVPAQELAAHSATERAAIRTHLAALEAR